MTGGDKPAFVNMTLRLTPELHDRLRFAAHELRASQQCIMVEAIEIWLAAWREGQIH
jgi:hypothetical protein